jgi:hypothetical protein
LEAPHCSRPAAHGWLLPTVFAVIATLAWPLPATAASFTAAGVTFSDELGGLVLEGMSGWGSMDDPFVVVERMTDPNGGTLEFRVDPALGIDLDRSTVSASRW